ncbi:hypothetical protein LAZ67_8000837 [Cordylochernes scorpioides]|uniref:ATP-dependent DNA helicase n=1 Tax=Cordylochernes scorpioides TaxID=51811 RepID=A0ABY6KRN9_9ARAC|nr:hypothetical protein LAZ67_8000837 [Cordylochernes scorpioides]
MGLAFLLETQTNENGYPLYRRRAPEAGVFTAKVKIRGREEVTIDNRWVVPYSPLLSKMTLLYPDVPQYYNWNSSAHEWRRRVQGKLVEGQPGVKRSDTIGRVYAVHVSNFECFCLRMLLHNIKGPTSFAYLKIVNGSQYETFGETCAAIGLLENDNHWVVTMDEAVLCQAPTRQLWITYRDEMASDILHRYQLLDSSISCKLLVWDECTMAHKIALEALDRTLQDIRDDPQPMGGLVVLLAGDFRQTLPVVTRGTPADELNACLKSSYLWSHIVKMHLTVNMRVQLHNDTTAAQFADELLKIGEGQLETDSEGNIQFSNTFCQVVESSESLTISRRLVANGLHSCRPLRRLPLTPPNRRQRLEWCRARSTWMTEWHRVVFSDESRFCLSSDSRRVRVWRRRGERSNPAAIVERPTVRQRGIMVWGAIAYDSRSPLLRIQGTMTAQRYVDDVLRPVTLPYLQGVPNALYQQDNARPHTARINQQALQDVQMLPWPPYSPDLSPIEHVWDIIGRRLHALPQPRSEDELWQMVEREWRAIPQDAIRTLIDSLPRRVAACIAVRGGPTCY